MYDINKTVLINTYTYRYTYKYRSDKILIEI